MHLIFKDLINLNQIKYYLLNFKNLNQEIFKQNYLRPQIILIRLLQVFLKNYQNLKYFIIRVNLNIINYCLMNQVFIIIIYYLKNFRTHMDSIQVHFLMNHIKFHMNFELIQVYFHYKLMQLRFLLNHIHMRLFKLIQVQLQLNFQ